MIVCDIFECVVMECECCVVVKVLGSIVEGVIIVDVECCVVIVNVVYVEIIGFIV